MTPDERIITARGDRWWRLRKPGRSEGEALIFATPRGELVVQGDTDLCSFAYGPGDARQCVAWIGRRGLDHYVVSKASIGSGDVPGLIRKLSAEKLAEDLRDRKWRVVPAGRAQGTVVVVGHSPSFASLGGAMQARIDEALQELADGGHPQDIVTSLWVDGVLESDDGWIGLVPTQRVIAAHAAVRRLHELLCEEER